jgi:hypothetical protein
VKFAELTFQRLSGRQLDGWDRALLVAPSDDKGAFSPRCAGSWDNEMEPSRRPYSSLRRKQRYPQREHRADNERDAEPCRC